MEVFIARQPIFTKNQELFAYELLYRNNEKNIFPGIDGDEATAEVIINSYLNIGIDKLSNSRPCFINFTEKLLQLKLPTYFRPREIVVEILETVDLNQETVNICKELKELGYRIALDDFILNESNTHSYQLMRYADIIKVDFRQSTEKMRRKIEAIAKISNVKLLAEKIETEDEFLAAKDRGYDFFQGYFFSKPIMVSTHDIPSYFHSYFEVLNQLSQDEPNIDIITGTIEQDLSFSYKLLKLVNSPAYRPKHKINSIRQAIVLLGLLEIKKWIYVLAFREQTKGKNDLSNELISLSLTRAKMSEYYAFQINKRAEASSYFMTGMFSLIDIILGLPLDKVLSELPLQDHISDALKGAPNPMKDALDLCMDIENGDWESVTNKCKELEIDEIKFLQYYHQAINWSNEIMKIK
ncbi:EAL and HDOD domain-containing protein [Bacillus massilinigeriensis]|uniref:EAL and HDOD domain-containing protein n=1 Tax=Bacillus massilionigeriensis TaxID=1805475 RepID=UPI00096B4A54|nr:EAL domain-containing protein [Bacillus massilionigeriensis]